MESKDDTLVYHIARDWRAAHHVERRDREVALLGHAQVHEDHGHF